MLINDVMLYCLMFIRYDYKFLLQKNEGYVQMLFYVIKILQFSHASIKL